MKKHLFFVSIILSFLCASCTKSNDNQDYHNIKITLNDDSYSFFEINKIVVLDSIEEAIIGGVTRISHLGENIIIGDYRSKNNLLLFNKDGKYLNTIPEGKGPYEITSIADYSIFDEKIYILDLGQKKMLITDFKLAPLNEFRIDVFGRYFKIIDNNNWLFYNQSKEFYGDQAYSYYLYPNTLEHPTEKFLSVTEDALTRVRMGNTISRSITEVLLCRPFDHFIYSFDSQQGIKKKYFLDFGNFNVTKDDLSEGLPVIYEKMRNGKKVSIDGSLINSSNFLACSFAYNSKLEYFVYNKSTQKSFTSFKSKQLPKGFLVGEHKDNLILIVQPNNLQEFIKSNKEYSKLNELKINNIHNYVLIYFQPK